MATYNDLITRAYKLAGVLGDGASMSGDQSETGLAALNELIDSWNSDNLNIYNIDILMIPIVGGQQTYTVGPGGSFNIPVRPPMIEAAWFRYVTVTPYVDLPIYLLSQQDWGNITSKGITGNLSQYGFYDGAFPLSNFNLWPIPNGAAGNLIIHAAHLLNSTVALTDTVALPPAYAMGIRYNLAMLLAAENQLEPAITVVNTAVRTKRLMEENNGQMLQRMGFDQAAMGSQGGRYMVQSDTLRV